MRSVVAFSFMVQEPWGEGRGGRRGRGGGGRRGREKGRKKGEGEGEEEGGGRRGREKGREGGGEKGREKGEGSHPSWSEYPDTPGGGTCWHGYNTLSMHAAS